MVDIVPLAAVPATAIEQLLDAAFGADRHGRTAYRIRQGTAALPDLSFAALERRALVGTIQCWPIQLEGDDGTVMPLIMVGPVAVDPAHQQSGIGKALMHHALAVAESTGTNGALILIGDPEYYGRFFGFVADRTAQWRAPGPVEQHRVLARGAAVPDRAGMLGPRIVAHA